MYLKEDVVEKKIKSHSLENIDLEIISRQIRENNQ